LKRLRLTAVLGLACAFFVGCAAQPVANNANNANANTKSNTNANTSASPATSNANTSTSGTTSGGTTYTHQEGGIQFTSPAGWKEKNEGDTVILSTPDDELEVYFYIPKDNDYDSATKDVADDLERYVKNIKITRQGEEGTLNGLKTYSVSGTGESDGEQVVWDLTVVGGKKPVYVVSTATPANFPKHESAYNSLITSIKPL
jgi:predicted Zn-dependent protease